jgi:hypothetical protein
MRAPTTIKANCIIGMVITNGTAIRITSTDLCKCGIMKCGKMIVYVRILT